MKTSRLTVLLLLLAPALPLRAAPSIEEKAAQLLIISAEAADISAATEAAKAGLGGVQLQWGSYSLEQTRRFTAALQAAAAASKEGTPLFISVDYEGGSVYVSSDTNSPLPLSGSTLNPPGRLPLT